jgi:hypothetical protein
MPLSKTKDAGMNRSLQSTNKPTSTEQGLKKCKSTDEHVIPEKESKSRACLLKFDSR